MLERRVGELLVRLWTLGSVCIVCLWGGDGALCVYVCVCGGGGVGQGVYVCVCGGRQ